MQSDAIIILNKQLISDASHHGLGSVITATITVIIPGTVMIITSINCAFLSISCYIGGIVHIFDITGGWGYTAFVALVFGLS